MSTAAPTASLSLFFSIACAAAAVDLVSKQWAIAALEGHRVPLAPRLSLGLVYNTASAGGVWLGEHTVALNALATLLAIVLTCAIVLPLTRVDRATPLTLGLIAGGGLGNLASILMSPGGVPDFIALHYVGGAIVVNVADLVVFTGLVLLGRTLLRLGGAMRRQAAVASRTVRG
jgi:lipoprotein signal peptidase